MTVRLSNFGALVVSGAMLGACAQLIGLNDYEDGSAGESGEGSGAKGGAAPQAGKGGMAGTGTTLGGTGGSGGSGGSMGGRVGKGGSAGKAGSMGTGGAVGKGGSGDIGGETSGGAPDVGGTGGSSTAGEAGAPSYDCASTEEITSVVLLPRDPDDGIYPANNTFGIQAPQIGSAADDELWVDFYASARYNGDAVGTFDLGAPPDDNYATCARCVWIGQDLGEVSDPTAYFYVKSGTMVVDAESKQMDGFPILSLDDITFIESTIDVQDTHVSTPVQNPRCLHLAHAEINIAPPPPAWKCTLEYYGSGDGCDCGCGALDPDCESPYGGACYACGETGACQDDQDYCVGIDPEDNSKCDTTPDWLCSILRYGDGSCDCGCGVVDVDCASSDPSMCVTCEDPDSCDSLGNCAEIDPSDNSKCVVP